jgi:hypothetical protein
MTTGLEPFRGRVYGGTQPGRPGSVDREVVLRTQRIAVPPEFLEQLADVVCSIRVPSGKIRTGSPGSPSPRTPILLASSSLPEFGPLERDVPTMQKIADRAALSRSVGPEQSHSGEIASPMRSFTAYSSLPRLLEP